VPRPRSGARIRGPYHDRARDRWRVDEFAAGESKPESSYFASEGSAQRYIELLESAFAARVRTTEEAIPQYERHLKEKGTQANSIATTVWALGEFFLEPVVLPDLTSARCQALYDDLRTRPKRVQVEGKWTRPAEGPPMSADSHRGILKQTRSFLRWCVAQGFVAANPAESVKGIGRLRPRGKSLGKAGTRIRIREARALYAKAVELAQAGDKAAAVALTAILCGPRASEIVRLRVRDLDSDQDEGDVLHVEDRKNHEDLELEVPDVLRPILLAFAEGKKPDAFLFDHGPGKNGRSKKAGKPYRRWYVRECVHKVCAAAGVPPITAHACRGLLATVAAERGMAGHLIAATLGNDEKVMSGAYAAKGALEAGGRRRGLEVLQGGRRA
jgi:integrase